MDAASWCNKRNGSIYSDSGVFLRYGDHIVIEEMKKRNISNAWFGKYFSPWIENKGKKLNTFHYSIFLTQNLAVSRKIALKVFNKILKCAADRTICY